MASASDSPAANTLCGQAALHPCCVQLAPCPLLSPALARVSSWLRCWGSTALAQGHCPGMAAPRPGWGEAAARPGGTRSDGAGSRLLPRPAASPLGRAGGAGKALQGWRGVSRGTCTPLLLQHGCNRALLASSESCCPFISVRCGYCRAGHSLAEGMNPAPVLSHLQFCELLGPKPFLTYPASDNLNVSLLAFKSSPGVSLSCPGDKEQWGWTGRAG